MTVVETLDIMLPHYGDTGLLQAAVRSVLDQTDKDWRLTVVDDGREEGVPEWFASLGDSRVRYLRNEQNLGITKNFRKCVGLVESTHFTMLGSDDLLLPEYVATIRAAVAAVPDAAIYQPGVQVIDENGTPSVTLADQVKKRLYSPRATERRVLSGEPLAANLLGGNWLYFPSICWRADLVKEIDFREDLSVIQDLALIIEIVRRGEKLVVEPATVFQYRRHSASLSSGEAVSGARFGEAVRFFNETGAMLDRHGWPKAARAARRHLSMRLHALTLVPGALLQRRTATVRKLLGYVLTSSP
ncbi:glycosyltransferase [Streptomyces sp. ID05-39B]|uniref:glycosyltransferase family 2 protein n=1 Tax=Streptomyces TaxID=1883 RepID=UPI0029BADDFA|nr:glycosyltransferase [Streptomyces sp. ID05-39B]MDX3527713.1 glycosyltransferase [Streptomyces sp. ID05-39B]